MQAHKDITLAPAHRAARGSSSSIDVSDSFLLTFNGNSVVLRPLNSPHQSLILNHVSDVAAARFSHDGRLVASIDVKGTLIISEPVPDRVIQVYQYHGVFPNAKYLDWSSDKKKVCVVGDGKNRFAKVLSIDTGVEVGQIGSVSATLNSCSFRPERPFKLVMGGDQFSLKGFDGPPYKYVKSEKVHSSFINHVQYSPKGNFVVSGGADRRLVLYDGKSYDKICEKENSHQGGVFGVDWIDQQHFVTVSSDKIIKIWNTKLEEKVFIESTTPENIKDPKNFSHFLVAVKYFKEKIYVANINGDVLVFNNPLNNNSSLSQTFYGNRSKIATLDTWSQNHLILLDSGGRVLSFDLQNQELSVCATEIEMNGISKGLALPESQRLIVLTSNGALWVYEGASPKDLKLVKMLDGIEFKHISRGQDGTQIIGFTNNKLMVYDIQGEKVLIETTIDEDITCLQSNQQFVLAGTIKGKVLIFNSELKPIEEVTLNTFKISTLNLFPTAQATVFQCLMGDACGKMSMIKISAEGVKPVKETMGGHSSIITGAARDSQKLYTFSMDGKICIWDGQTLMRESDIKNSVNGGILCGLSLGDNLVISGNDMVTKILKKGK